MIAVNGLAASEPYRESVLCLAVAEHARQIRSAV